MVKTSTERIGDVADYDMENDSFFAYSKEMKYKSSIDLDGIILDIAEDNSLMGVEILDISERFGITKYDASNYKKLNVRVKVSEKLIKVEIAFSVLKRNASVPRSLKASTLNSMNLPVGSESLAVIV
jgi:hypothetical protein